MPRGAKIPHRNLSPSGWWVFIEVQQWVSDRQGKAGLKPGSRCKVWKNTRLIRAKDREAAYAKAMALGAEGMPSRTIHGEWRFAGLTELLPVYEDLEDGAEILWGSYEMSVKTLKSQVKRKRELGVFDDTLRECDVTPR